MKKILIILTIFILGCSSERDIDILIKQSQDIVKEAEGLFKGKIDSDPANEVYKIDFARFYYEQRQYEKAEEILKDLASDNACALRAKIFFNQGEYTEAISLFDRLDIEKDPEALFLYAQCLEHKNLFPKAKEIYKKLIGTKYQQQAEAHLQAMLSVKTELSGPILKYIETQYGQKDYPDADSIVIFSDESIEITEDNKSIYTARALIKILNDRGRDRWAELDFNYDSTYEKIELEFARTITPDKQVVTVGKESIRDVSRYTNFPLYSNARAYIVSMPQVNSGYFIEYKIKIYKSKLVNKKDFSTIYRFYEPYPILNSKIIFRVPKNRDVNFTVLNKEYLPDDFVITPQKREVENNIEYEYIFNNISQLVPESNMVYESFVNPGVLFSTFKSWDEYYKWWTDLYKDKLVLNKEMKDFLDDLLKKAESDKEKARLIYEFCSQKIRYVAIEYGEAGYEPHKSDEVFFNRYGDCKDQAILLVALMRSAGLKAYPVLIPTKDVYNLRKESVASYFNHAIACVMLDNKLIFMDPTSSTAGFNVLPLGDQDRDVLVFYEDKYEIVKTPLQESNLLYSNMQINIDDNDRVVVKRSLEYSGIWAAAYRAYYKNTPPTVIKDNVQTKMRSWASLAQLNSLKIENIEDFTKNPILTYEFTASNFLSNAQKMRILPVLGEECVNASFIDKDKRKYPLDLDGLYTIKANVEITLPKSLNVLYLPENLSVSSKWGDLFIKFTHTKNKIKFEQDFKIKTDIVNEKQYEEFKRCMEDILYKSKQQAILIKN